MRDFESQAWVRCEGNYHVVLIPKNGREVLYGKLAASTGQRDYVASRDLRGKRKLRPTYAVDYLPFSCSLNTFLAGSPRHRCGSLGVRLC
jgi:hypothetical protein